MNSTNKSDTTKTLPNLFIVGAAKAGTTALVQILEQHPKIFVCPIKEPNFFNTEVKATQLHPSVSEEVILTESYFNHKPLKEKHLALVQNEQAYLKLFETQSDFDYYCDASTGYLYSPVAAKNIAHFNPNARIIIILREPIKRTWSHFHMDVARGIQKSENIHLQIQKDFESTDKGYLKTHLYIDLSLYYKQIKRYYELFPPAQILLLRQEDLASDPERVLKVLSEFLNLDCTALNAGLIANETRIPRFSWMKYLKRMKRFVPQGVVRWIKKKGLLFKKPETNTQAEIAAKLYIEQQVKDDWNNTLAFIQEVQQQPKIH